jgi:pilus assembly protein CpaB
VSRRARGLALLGAAAACAGLAASSVSRYTNEVRAQVGPVVSVVVARAEVPSGTAITPDVARRSLDERRVPVRFAPPQALASISAAIGYRLAVELRRGDYVSQASLAAAEKHAGADEGGRLVEVSVAGAGSLADVLEPGAHVEVLITTDTGAGPGPGRTYLALQDAELVSFSGADPGAETAKARATLRVSLRQAVLLTAAQNFARELRLVPRPAGERRTLGAVGVSASGFGR